jgi:hypothetical protein
MEGKTILHNGMRFKVILWDAGHGNVKTDPPNQQLEILLRYVILSNTALNYHWNDDLYEIIHPDLRPKGLLR